MTEDDLRRRTKRFAIEAIAFARNLPSDESSRIISKQFVRCATSVGANYRSACRAKSRPDMICKFRIVEEEIDEAMYWLELLEETGTVPKERTLPLHDEANQLLRITVASIRTLKSSSEKSKI